jgi:hypothetical protein
VVLRPSRAARNGAVLARANVLVVAVIRLAVIRLGLVLIGLAPIHLVGVVVGLVTVVVLRVV